ncbi:carbon-nitrogen hydrolase family protein [Aliifodinibius sp. S!AR15-10]|uniref:carbon-nitrogen hydrolase family protein n=1 Tax=Aliifodinibius sp. S!AR15-10 TaxID=2950437 RepID=UPI002865CE5E|nr:carbon-nitrogen hydrolase family protein [Aliifodinibius sp. S!AR15-10]MDR8391394.1 carbon-nitrogen hydrolase family protein [Aliifodinibius sp. S!AR15-10]
MKICIAQIRPVKGNVEQNIQHHKGFIETALSNQADMIIFPELSLTGYEPELAEQLATKKNDRRFNDFQKISDEHQITIVAGMPLKSPDGIIIGMLIFQSEEGRTVYGKKYLHADEEPFFASGSNLPWLLGEHNNIALAICYELSVPAHSEHAYKSGAKVYLASVAKVQSGVEKASKELSNIAGKYSMTVLMANAVGEADGDICAGQSAVWNDKGELIGQLNDNHEGIIIFDTESQEITQMSQFLDSSP